MNQTSTNPYDPPSAAHSVSAERPRGQQLFPLWIWLGVAVLASFFGTPPDPISMIIALAYGLISFWVGAILGSSLKMSVRIIPAVLWCIPAIALALLNSLYFFLVVWLCYLMVSIIIGFWASRRINNGRLRIILYFSAGYVLGSVVGALGTVAGAVLGALLAKSSLAKPDSR
ncbi:MAG: hypothetical protein ACQESR_16215 [Planctomycetota bacterium]